ncbi:branched-chain amino acid ABC transporter permease (plasmid) [Rhizobium leguminosarum bv. viciae]|nr:branched-chain amino acid ABC transporter permease [Rhizobium leguminosarum bv. viciae]
MAEVLQIFVGGVLLGAIYALIALGFSLIYRVTGVVNLSQGGFAVLAALAGYTFSQQLGFPLPIALLCAVAGTTIAGLAIGWFTFVPALKKLSNANVLMLTVGILTLIEGFSLVTRGSQPYSVPAFSGERPLEFTGLRITTQTFWILGTAPGHISGGLVPDRAHENRQGLEGMFGKSICRGADGHRRQADELAELHARDADCGNCRCGRRSDDDASVQYGAALHNIRLHSRGHRRHFIVSRCDRRGAVPRTRHPVRDSLCIVAVQQCDRVDPPAFHPDLCTNGAYPFQDNPQAGRSRRTARLGPSYAARSADRPGPQPVWASPSPSSCRC